MNLTIDIGNNRVKCGIFNKAELLDILIFDELLLPQLKSVSDRFPLISSVIVSSVTDFSVELREYLSTRYKLIELNEKTPVPVKNLYITPETLGNDRLSAAVGANALYPRQNVLTIDAGTCIKYDFVNERNEYEGGSISPGIAMRFKALNTFTAKLPLLTPTDEMKLIGKTTTESIWSGVQNGVIAEVDGIIDEYKKSIAQLRVVVTGGDLNFLDKRLKNSIFADPFLVLKGLNIILNYNVNKHTY